MPKGNNKKVTGLMKDELRGKAMIKLVRLRAKRQKAQNVYHKKKLKFEIYKNCLKATQLENKINHLLLRKKS